MRSLKLLALLSFCFLVAPYAQAHRFEVGIAVGPAYVGPPPVCPYGYYGYYPYACAPYGYYGPSWFSAGVFIGAGPWFHGSYGRHGYYGRTGYYSRSSVRGPIAHGPGYSARGPAFSGRAFRGGYNRSYVGGGFHGAAARGYAHGGGHR